MQRTKPYTLIQTLNLNPKTLVQNTKPLTLNPRPQNKKLNLNCQNRNLIQTLNLNSKTLIQSKKP